MCFVSYCTFRVPCCTVFSVLLTFTCVTFCFLSMNVTAVKWKERHWRVCVCECVCVMVKQCNSFFSIYQSFFHLHPHRWKCNINHLCAFFFLHLYLQVLEVGLLSPQTGISGWRSTWVSGPRSQLSLLRADMAALIGWHRTCWCSVTQDTTGDSTDRRTALGWVNTVEDSLSKTATASQWTCMHLMYEQKFCITCHCQQFKSDIIFVLWLCTDVELYWIHGTVFWFVSLIWSVAVLSRA